MATCFVIQPFDKGKFDKRFQGVFKPAIEAAGLQAYRVDEDPSVDVPISAIEKGIQDSAVCLADITTDNPNVWYELGFAFATGRPVVLLCGPERTSSSYPFDIQHRTIISYQSEGPNDFEILKGKIRERIVAALKKEDVMQSLAESNQVAESFGLSQHEVIVLAEIAGEVGVPGSTYSVYRLQNEAEKVGLTKIGFSLALRKLRAKGFVTIEHDVSSSGDEYDAVFLSDKAWAWIEGNETLFILKREKIKSAVAKKFDDVDDDIPF